MGSLDTVKHDNFTMRGYLADSRKEDPRRCWPFQSLIDYYEFRRISESTPAVSEIRRNQKGVVIGSENPSDSDDDIPLAELLRRRKALKVQAQNLAPARLCPVSSSDGLELLSTVAMMWGSGSRVNGARVQSAEKPRPDGSSGRLQPPGSGSRVNGARVQAAEKPRPDGSSGRLQPPGLMPRMREPVRGIDGARVQAPVMAPAGPPEREIIVCRVSRNPAEFSPEEAKLFMRTL